MFESHHSTPGPKTLCLVQSSIPPPSAFFSGRWKTPWLFQALKTEPPLKPSELAAERCVRRILKEQRPLGYGDSVSPFLASKNKGIPEKIRAGPHPKPRLLLLPPPPSLLLSHAHIHTFHGNVHRHKHTAEQWWFHATINETHLLSSYSNVDFISAERWRWCVCVNVCVNVWRWVTHYLAQIHISQPSLSLLLLTIARQHRLTHHH